MNYVQFPIYCAVHEQYNEVPKTLSWLVTVFKPLILWWHEQGKQFCVLYYNKCHEAFSEYIPDLSSAILHAHVGIIYVRIDENHVTVAECS